MSKLMLPRLLEPLQLESMLGDDRLIIVDLSALEVYEDVHVPGALHLDYSDLLSNSPPAVG